MNDRSSDASSRDPVAIFCRLGHHDGPRSCGFAAGEHPVQQDTPDVDKAARTIAENVYAAFARMATTPAEPLAEQTVLTRSVEAIRPQVPSDTGRR